MCFAFAYACSWWTSAASTGESAGRRGQSQVAVVEALDFYMLVMELQQSSRNTFGSSANPRPLGRSENEWAEPNGIVPRASPPRSESPLPLIAPVTMHSSSPLSSDYNNTTNPLGRRNYFEDEVDARPLSPQVVESEELEEEKEIFVTHVESPVLFWAQGAEHDTVEMVKTLVNKLQIYCINKPLLQSTPLIGKVYGGVYSEDKQWYRCRVKKLVEDDKVEVHFVDFGNTEVISLRTIVFLSHEILSLVPFAQLYCLDGLVINRHLSDQGKDKLHELIGNKVLNAQLKGKKMAFDVACPVVLSDKGESGIGDIADEMIRHGFVSATIQDGPPPLFSRATLSEAVIKDMEELRKGNEALRNMIKVYQDNEKAVDEIKKFYSIQAAKYKEMMEHAVNDKVLELVSKVRDLKKLRGTSPTHRKTSDVIQEAINLSRNDRIDVKSLRSLQQVKEFESQLQERQKCLAECKGKGMMSDLVLKRNEVRQHLSDAIELFCKEVCSLPLQERKHSLEHSLCQLEEERGILTLEAFDSCSDAVSVEEAVEVYKKWQERIQQDMMSVRQKVNKCSEDITEVLANLQLALKMKTDVRDEVPQTGAFGNLDALIAALSSAAQEEVDKNKVSEDKEGKKIAALTLKTLVSEHKTEIAGIEHLRDHLLEKYRNLKIAIMPWLESKPDVKKIDDVRRTIKSLRSRLRHRLADKKDLEEGDDVDVTEELEKVQSDISVIYFQLHQSFEEESKCMADLARTASDHFPELPDAHPEIGILDYWESDGLVKRGRELEHYPYHDSVPNISYDKCSVIDTEYGGIPCRLKELSLDRELGDSNTLLNRAVSFSRINSPFLVPLEAFFVKGNRAFVQMPLMKKFEEWQASDEYSFEGMIQIFRDALEGVRVLHSNNICHGCLHLQAVLVEKVDGLFRGRLDFYPFGDPCDKAQDWKSFEDFVMKIPNMDHMLMLPELAEELHSHDQASLEKESSI
ncbi:serine/threonine-protein kinase 31-like isoform X5 [Acropora muricata]|uniref:serine/threonine-protein kinase 31-like isoform X5 n=1 Tax=Acropora muricata TaxID=159855 RepID=UPI0034E3F662